jgi:hypothetical protein
VGCLGVSPHPAGSFSGTPPGHVSWEVDGYGGSQNRAKLALWTITAVVIFGFWISYLWGSSYCFPSKSILFLLEACTANDMRDAILWNPLALAGDFSESVSRTGWILSTGLDVIASVVLFYLGLRNGLKSSTLSKGRWKSYRLVVLPILFLGLALYVNRSEINDTRDRIENWYEEVYAFAYTEKLYQLASAVLEADTHPRAIELDSLFEAGESLAISLPERHYLIALKQIKKGNEYYAKAELDRAIYAAEQMQRRFWGPTGEPLHRDILLAQLYQLRAKMNLQKAKFIVAERDLTVAIFIYRDWWLVEEKLPRHGLFEGQNEILKSAQYISDVGFASCFYERFLARKNLDAEQAEQDLREAASLEISTSLVSNTREIVFGGLLSF